MLDAGDLGIGRNTKVRERITEGVYVPFAEQ